MDFEFARTLMIEQQIRTWGVTDERVLTAIRTIKRECFAPPLLRFLALADLELPLGFGQIMLPPKMEARILQALAPQPHEKHWKSVVALAIWLRFLPRSHAWCIPLKSFRSCTIWPLPI